MPGLNGLALNWKNMKTKILENPWAIEMLTLIKDGMDSQSRGFVAGPKTVVIPSLINAGYLSKNANQYYTITFRGKRALEAYLKKQKVLSKASSKTLSELGNLIVKPHFRQADIDAIRAVPSLFNGVSYVSK
jgi:hypothetical protein